MLFEPIDYKIDETPFGTWRRFLHPNGQYFAEFRSHSTVLGFPLVHYTRGICPETGGRRAAIGVIAVGRMAFGLFALGQLSVGVIAIGQLGIGLIFGLGQATTGLFAIGQLAISAIVGVGQFASGYIAIGQGAVGHYVLAQRGFGTHVWDQLQVSPAAKAFFGSLF